MNEDKLNQVYTKPGMRRRYEVWFLKLRLADGSGAWWLRYLTTNLGGAGGGGCARVGTMPLQVWATWFPAGGAPVSCIEGFPLEGLQLSGRGEPFSLSHGANRISPDSCEGDISAGGRRAAWKLHYRSGAGFPMSEVGWIGFSKTPHSDAVFEGELSIDGRTFSGSPLGYGLQGHNCGFRHRNLWSWAHSFSINDDGSHSTFEALEYEIGLGIHFRRALLWHEGRLHILRGFSNEVRRRAEMKWSFVCGDSAREVTVAAEFDGSGLSLQKLPYTRTDCSGTFEVSNNSLAASRIRVSLAGRDPFEFRSNGGAVLEMVGGKI